MSESSDIAAVTAQAKEKAGGPVALAAALSASGERISSQAVSKWVRVPAERVLEVERLSGISRHRLRPDVFGELAAGSTKTSAVNADESSASEAAA